MTARERPWMKFYPADWRAEPRLRNCGLMARGLWMEMLALMHESDRYGYLLVNGKEPTDRQLAVQAGATIDEVAAAVAELESEGVFSRDRNGTIYSRRMIRDEKRAEHARRIGKKGGNPKLSEQKENQPQDNRTDKLEDNGGVKAHKPEARDQKVEREESTQSQPSLAKPREPSLPADVRAIMETGEFISPPNDLAMLREWYAAGADLQQDILPTVRAVRARLSKPPFKLKVFDAAIREKLAADEHEIEGYRRMSARYERIEAEERERAAAGGQC